MSIEFEPVRLGRRGRRLDPVAVGATAVAFALGLALLKPWGAAPDAFALGSPAPVESTDAETAAGSDAPVVSSPLAVGLPRVIQARAMPASDLDSVARALRRHDSWGLRAVLRAPASDGPATRIVERWFRFPAGGIGQAEASMGVADVDILAFGVTFPTAHTPLDVRIWREGVAGLEWVAIAPLDAVPSDGAFTYVQPVGGSASLRPWASGRYRIDVLVDDVIRRFGVTVPDRPSDLRTLAPRPSLRDIGRLAPATDASLADLPVGSFATVDGTAVPLTAVEGDPLDEAAAWLDVDPGTGREPRSFVARAYLPRATGLGVALPERSVVMAAQLERLAPGPASSAPARVDVGVGGETASSVALFEAPDRSTWPPGVYRLSVRWADVEGLHDGSWHVELRPSGARDVPVLLAAARSWARYAGQTGVLLGTAEPLEGGRGSVGIRLVDLRPASAGYPAPQDVGCGGTVIGSSPGILGFGFPAERYAPELTSRIVRPFLRRDDMVLLTATAGIPGLILATPARLPTLPSATHVFTVGSGTESLDYTLCLGMQSFDD